MLYVDQAGDITTVNYCKTFYALKCYFSCTGKSGGGKKKCHTELSRMLICNYFIAEHTSRL